MANNSVPGILDDSIATQDDRTTYAPSGWRKTIFGFLFLLLLPFAASVPMMLGQRLLHGAVTGSVGLVIVGAGLAIVTLLVLFELIYSLRAEVDVGEKTVRFTVPSGAVGWLPSFFYRTEEIAYADIARIEHTCELCGGRVTPLLVNCTRIHLRDGRVVPLGTCNEQNPDHTFPYDRIAQQIAERAGLEIQNGGHFRQKRAFALIQPGRAIGEPVPVSDTEISDVNRRHRSFAVIVSIAIGALLVLGIVSDLLSVVADGGDGGIISRLFGG